MNHRNIVSLRRTLLWIFAVTAVGIILAITLTKQTPHALTNHKTTQQSSTPCASDVAPCIALHQDDGTTYKLNDFRFVPLSVDPRRCILFVSLPDHAHVENCGQWRLEWIGPGNSPRGLQTT